MHWATIINAVGYAVINTRFVAKLWSGNGKKRVSLILLILVNSKLWWGFKNVLWLLFPPHPNHTKISKHMARCVHCPDRRSGPMRLVCFLHWCFLSAGWCSWLVSVPVWNSWSVDVLGRLVFLANQFPDRPVFVVDQCFWSTNFPGRLVLLVGVLCQLVGVADWWVKLHN